MSQNLNLFSEDVYIYFISNIIFSFHFTLHGLRLRKKYIFLHKTPILRERKIVELN